MSIHHSCCVCVTLLALTDEQVIKHGETVCMTCELTEASDRETTRPGDKLQQARAMFIVETSHELQHIHSLLSRPR